MKRRTVNLTRSSPFVGQSSDKFLGGVVVKPERGKKELENVFRQQFRES